VYRSHIPKILSGAIIASRNPTVPNFYLTSVVDFTNVPEDEWDKYYSADGVLTSVKIEAVGFATNFETKSISHTVSTPSGEFQRFYEITLSDPDVQQIAKVIDGDGNVYYEVDYLAQDTIFDFVVNENDSQNNVPYIIFEKRVPRRFIRKQFVGSDGKIYTKLVFGNTNETNYNESLFNINPNDLVFPTLLSGLSADSVSI